MEMVWGGVCVVEGVVVVKEGERREERGGRSGRGREGGGRWVGGWVA